MLCTCRSFPFQDNGVCKCVSRTDGFYTFGHDRKLNGLFAVKIPPALEGYRAVAHIDVVAVRLVCVRSISVTSCIDLLAFVPSAYAWTNSSTSIFPGGPVKFKLYLVHVDSCFATYRAYMAVIPGMAFAPGGGAFVCCSAATGGLYVSVLQAGCGVCGGRTMQQSVIACMEDLFPVGNPPCLYGSVKQVYLIFAGLYNTGVLALR